MKKSILIGIVTLIMSVAFMKPSPTYAGDKEWATAGKILTGVVAANVLGDIVWSDRYVKIKSHRYQRPFHNKGFSKKCYYKNNGHVYDISWKKYRGNKRYRRFGKTRTYAPKCASPVIVHLEDGRRIYQPRIKGATAYLQVYNELCHEWITIKQYPSIW